MNNDECSCICHEPNTCVIHCLPCCFPCPTCGKNISKESIRTHMKECKKEHENTDE